MSLLHWLEVIMRGKIISVVIGLCMMIGCGQPSMTSAQSQTENETNSTSAVSLSSSAPESSSSVVAKKISISDEEQEKLLDEMVLCLSEGKALMYLYWYGMEIDMTHEPIVRMIDNTPYNYYPTTEFESLSKLKDYTLKFFSVGFAEKLLFSTFELDMPNHRYPFSDQAMFIEQDGRLYYTDQPSGGGVYQFLLDTIAIINADDTSGEISVQVSYPEQEPQAFKIRVVNENDRWVLDSLGRFNFWQDGKVHLSSEVDYIIESK